MSENRSQEQIIMAAASDVGNVREENEDFYYFSKSKKFFIVCDGMGGHQKGDLASRIAGETIRDILFARETVRHIVIENEPFDLEKANADIAEDLPLPALKLAAGIRLANRRILQNALRSNQLKGMGTTISCVLIHKGTIIIAHVGDSRVYRLRQGELSCLTSDHSWVNELLEDKEITQQDAENFEKKNVLTRALGIAPSVKIDLKIAPVHPDDLYLLCSDGLHNALRKELIQSVLCAFHGSLQNKISNLVNSARLMDGSDNITGGLIHVDGNFEAQPEDAIREIVIPEEPEQITAYLDRALKTIYPKKSVTKTTNRRGIFAMGAIASLLIFLALLFVDFDETPEASTFKIQPTVASTPVALNTTQTRDLTGAEPAGIIALVQVQDSQVLDRLAAMPGVRIVDKVERFKNDIPAYAGDAAWIIADPEENILYKNDRIILESVSQTSPSGNYQSRDNDQVLFRPLKNKTSKDNALVYLVGRFNSEEYDMASIFVNDTFFGRLSQFHESGFYLPKGTYTIEVKNRANATLNKKQNIKVNNGETIAIEF